MARQSISVTEPNDQWLRAQIESQEYSSKSELINDLIRQARKREEQLSSLRSKLDSAEQSGFSNRSKEEILLLAKSRMNG